MNPQPYLATTSRILRQLAADHRSVAMILVVPSAVITLMYFMFHDVPHPPFMPAPFNNACLIMLGLFPLIIMFLIPLALKGVKYQALGAATLLRRNLAIYGLGGLIAPFIGIKAIDLLLVAAGLA